MLNELLFSTFMLLLSLEIFYKNIDKQLMIIVTYKKPKL